MNNKTKFKMQNSNMITFHQKKILKNATSLPLNIIEAFHKHLNMKIITQTTPMAIIIKNTRIPWNKKELVKKKDLRMEHTPYFNLKWNYYKLTIDEPDKCNIAKHPELKWDTRALICINTDKLCNEHLIAILNRYPDLNWNWSSLTRKIPIKDIINNMSLSWNINEVIDRLEDLEEEYRTLVLFRLPHDKIDWKKMTICTSWSMIAKYPDLPWSFKDKYSCECETNCNNKLTLWILKKLKNKQLDWKNITEFMIYKSIETIYNNQDIPWDEKTIVDNFRDIPFWFIYNTKYNWDNRKVTMRVSWTTVLTYPNYNWDFDAMPKTSCIPNVWILSKYPDLDWDWDRYSSVFNYDDIMNYNTLKWNWNIIANRSDIPFWFALRFIHKKWNANNILGTESNKDIFKTLTILKNNFDLDVSLIIFNKFY